MFEQLLCDVLNRLLGDIVLNLSTEQLNLQIWAGDVVLKGLELRRDALQHLLKDVLPSPTGSSGNGLIDVRKGYLGEFRMQIPWAQLKTKPVKILIKDVFLLCCTHSSLADPLDLGSNTDLSVPPSTTTATASATATATTTTPKTVLSSEEQAQRRQKKELDYKLKLERLETAEMFDMQLALGTASSTPGTDASSQQDQQASSFVEQLVTKMIDNLQVSIENIHLRYEHDLLMASSSTTTTSSTALDHAGTGNHVALGLTIKQLMAVSTDDCFTPPAVGQFVTTVGSTVFKLARLTDLAVYFDTQLQTTYRQLLDEGVEFMGLFQRGIHHHQQPMGTGPVHEQPTRQYLLQPVCGVAKIKMNRHPTPSEPKLAVLLEFEQFAFKLDSDQYIATRQLTAYFSRLLLSSRYAKFHPSPLCSPLTHPREFWKFAQRCVLRDVRDRRRVWTWEWFKSRRDIRKQYVRLFKNKMQGRFDALIRKEKDLVSQGGQASTMTTGASGSVMRQKSPDRMGAPQQKKAHASSSSTSSVSSLGSGYVTAASSSTQSPPAATVAEREETVTRREYETYRQLEMELNYADLRLYRQIAHVQLWKEEQEELERQRQAKQGDVVKGKKAESPKKEGGWFSWMFSGASDGQSSKKTGLAALTDEQKKALFDTIGFDVHNGAAGSAVDVPDSAVLLDVAFRLTKGSITLAHDPHSISSTMGKSMNLIQLETGDLDVSMKLMPRSWQLESKLGRMDVVANDSIKLLEPNGARADASGGKPIFSMTYLTYPPSLLKSSDASLSMTAAPMTWTYIPSVIFDILAFFTPPSVVSSQDVEVMMQDLKQGVNSRLEQVSKGALSIALEGHQSIDVSMDIWAPVVVLPLDLWPQQLGKGYVVPEDIKYVVVDLGHFVMTSRMVDRETKKQVADKIVEMTSEQVEQLMYDRYIMGLLDLQVTMAKTLPECTVRTQELSVDSDLFLIPRTSFNLTVDMSIMPKALNLSRVRVSGGIPNLQVNFSDYKYEVIKRVLAGLTGEEVGDGQVAKGVASDPSSPVSGSNQQIYSDVTPIEDEETEKANQEQARQQGRDTEELRSQGDKYFLSEVLRGNITVERLRLLVSRNRESSTGSREWHKRGLLADMSIDGVSIDLLVRPNDICVDVSAQRIAIKDELQKLGPKYAMLLSSDLQSVSTAELDQQWAKFKYRAVDRTHPKFHEQFDGLDQLITVDFSSAHLMVNSMSVMGLYDFLLSTFVEVPDAMTSPVASSLPSPSSPSADKKDLQALLPSNTATPAATKKTAMQFQFSMDQFQITLNQERGSLASAVLTKAKIKVDLRENETMAVFMSLGMVRIKDMISRVEKQQFNEFIGMKEGKKFFDLILETYKPTLQGYPGYDTLLKIRGGAVQLTYLEDFYTELLDYLNQFVELSVMVEQARKAAVQQAEQISQNSSRMRLDVELDSPVLVVPKSLASSDRMLVYLGALAVQSTFVDQSGVACTRYDIALKNIGLRSSIAAEAKEMPVLDDLDLKMNVCLPIEDAAHSIPEVDLKMDLSEWKLQFSEPRFIFLLDMYQMMMDSPIMGVSGSQTTSTPVVKSASKRSLPSADTAVWTKFQGHFVMPKFTIQLLNVDGQLAEFTIFDMGVKVITCSDESLQVDVSITDLVLRDVRPANTLFRDIFPPIGKGKKQLVVEFSVTPTGDSILIVTVDSPKLIMVPDHMFAVKDFFMNGLESSTISKAKQPTQMQVQQSLISVATNTLMPEVSVGPTFSFRVNVVDMECLILRDSTLPETDAIALAADQLVIAQENILSLAVSQLSLSLCNMHDRPGTTLRVIQAFDLTFFMDNRPQSGSSNSALSLDIPQPLVLRISYHDVEVLMEIVQKFVGTTAQSVSPARSTAPPINPPVATALEKTESFISHVQKMKDAGLEKFHVACKGLRFILIDDLNNLHLPMFDGILEPFAAEMLDWSTQLRIKTNLALQLSFYNVNNSHWEPVIEPWKFVVDYSSKDGSSKVLVSADKRLEVDVSQDWLQTLMFISNAWNKKRPGAGRPIRLADAPYILKNQTGFTLAVWIDKDEAKDVELVTLEAGAEVPFRFEDWKALREEMKPKSHKLNVQVKGQPWETLRGVQVDRRGATPHPLRPRADNIPHCIVCDVQLDGNVKNVIFRSAYQVVNHTKLDMEIMTVDERNKELSAPLKLESGKSIAVPIRSCFDGIVKIRPDSQFGYKWPSGGINWRNLITSEKSSTVSLTCPTNNSSAESTSSNFILHAHATYDKKDPLCGRYPSMSLELMPPFELENLLPYAISYSIIDQQSQQAYTGSLEKGDSTPIHLVRLENVIGLKIKILGSEFSESRIAVVNTPDDFAGERHIPVVDNAGKELRLRLTYAHLSKGSFAKRVSISSPYVIINKTGLQLSFKTRALLTDREAAGQGSSASSEAISNLTLESGSKSRVKPFMMSLPKGEPVKSRVYVKTSDSDWSRSIGFDTIGAVTEVVLDKTSNSKILLGTTVNAGEGKYRLTKVVTFAPRYVLRNNLLDELHVRCYGSDEAIPVAAKQSIPLYVFSKSGDMLMSLRDPKNFPQWSAAFNFNDVGKVYVKMTDPVRKVESLARIEVLIEGPTIFVVVNREEKVWPFRIDNDSNVDVIVYQHSARPRYKIGQGQSMVYTWDEPAIRDKALFVHVNGYEREVNIQEIGPLMPFHYVANESNPGGILAMNVTAEGPTLVLSFHEWSPNDSIYRRTQDQKKNENFEVIDADTTENMTIQLKLAGIGLSMIDRNRQELLYFSLSDVLLTFRDTAIHQTLGCSIRWLQIDNQAPDAGDDMLILYPTMLSRQKKDETVPPVFQVALVRSKDTSYGVDYYKYFTLLLQEVSLELDEIFLLKLVDFFKFDVQGWNMDEGSLWDEKDTITEPKYSEDGSQMYFEVLQIQPARFNITFARSENSSLSLDLERSHNPIMFVLNVFTLAIGNVTDAPIKLNALIMEHPIFTLPVLTNLITKYYTQEVLGQIHRIIGSADVLGNPVGLFNTLGSGVKDVFYEPYMGFVSDRPQDFGIGLAKGTASFMRKTIYGFSDTFSKMTGSVGKGLASATMDQEFQERRRAMKSRNKPRHAIKGVSAGASSLAHSVISGVTGIVEQPLKGAEKEGFGGFLKGIGRGIVGAVTKPVVGVFDLASNVTEGIRNTTMEDTGLDRIRPPRFIDPSGILKPYNERESYGANLIREVDHGRRSHEVYYAHLDLPASKHVALVSLQNIMIVTPGTSGPVASNVIPYSDIRSFQMFDKRSVQIVLEQGLKLAPIRCSDERSAAWLQRKMEEALQNYQATNRLAE